MRPENNAATGRSASQSASASAKPASASLATERLSPGSNAIRRARHANHSSSAKLTQAPIEVAEREADLRVAVHQHDLERDIDRDRDRERLDRRHGIAAGEEGDGDAAHQHERQQADRIGRERRGGGLRIGRGEGAAHEQRAHDEIGHQQEGDQAGHRQQQRELDRAVLRVARARSSPAAMRLAISGSSTVPAAMPITPIGSWLSRSA